MKRLLPLFAALGLFAAGPALASSLEIQVNGQVYTGAPSFPHVTLAATIPITVTYLIKDGHAAEPPWLKHGDDVQMNGAGTNPQPKSDEYSFFVTPLHAGKVSFPGFDIKTTDGQTLHAIPITLTITPLK